MTKTANSEPIDVIRIGDWSANDWDEFDEDVASVETWYDKYTRLWCIQLLNSDGYQVGQAIWVYGKKDAMTSAEQLKIKYGL